MIRRPTALVTALSILAGWAVFLGIAAGQPALFVVAVPLFVALLSARPPDPAALAEATSTLSAVRLIEGEAVTLALRLRAADTLPLVEIVLPLPAALVPAALVPAGGRPHFAAALARGETLTRHVALRAGMRGRGAIGHVVIRLCDRAGLCAVEFNAGNDTIVQTYPQIPRVRHLPRPGRTRATFGNYVAPQLGAGLEPGDIRPYTPGDRIRQINWPVSLRLRRLHVTRFHEERNADIVLLLDTLADSGVHPGSSLDHAVQAAVALAAAYLARKDRVGLIDYGGYLRWVRPASGRRHLESLVEAVLPADIVFTYVAKDLAFVPPAILPARALVIAISALIDERFIRAVADLAGRGYEVVLLAVSPVAATRPALPPGRASALACRLWTIERRRRVDALPRRGIVAVEWEPDRPLELALAGVESGRRTAPAGR